MRLVLTVAAFALLSCRRHHTYAFAFAHDGSAAAIECLSEADEARKSCSVGRRLRNSCEDTYNREAASCPGVRKASRPAEEPAPTLPPVGGR